MSKAISTPTGPADDRLSVVPARTSGHGHAGSLIVVPVGTQTIPVSSSISSRIIPAPDAAADELWIRSVWIGRRSGRWVLHTAGIMASDAADGAAG